MTKILVISDIHYPDRIVNFPDISDAYEGCDGIIGIGDYTSVEILDYLKSLTRNFFGVCGNMDSEKIKEILPKKRVIVIDRLKIAVFHGYGSPKGIQQRIKDEFSENVDAYLFGHSHIPFRGNIFDKYFFNPGAFCNPKKEIGYIYIELGNIWGEFKALSDF